MRFFKYENGRVSRPSSRVLLTLAVSIFAYFHTFTIAHSAPRHLFAETPAQKSERLSWWTHDRFGMFIHFGLYAIPARGEWIKMTEPVSDEKYDEYFRLFNPNLFDARDWARRAKAAGMKYAVLTTKHHDGFCLWDSRFTDYKVTNTPFGRDIVREFVEAFRAEGLHVGFYYSLLDWHHPDFTIDMCHPGRPKMAKKWEFYGTTDKDFPTLNRNRDMARYRQYMKDQIRELLTNYGKVDILWMDFTYPEPNGKTHLDWDSEGLLRLVRSLQPQVIVNNRMGLYDTADGWDFVTPEQFKVCEWPTVRGERVHWEACQTFSGKWGYHRDAMTWKSDAELIELLVHSVSKGGNLIMNVGPNARGEFDDRAKRKLEAYARWTRLGESVYGCTQAPERFRAPDGTLLTYAPKTHRLFIHLLCYPGKDLVVDFGDEISFARFLHDGSEIKFSQIESCPENKLYRHGGEGLWQLSLPPLQPDVVNPVVEIILKNKNTLMHQWQ